MAWDGEQYQERFDRLAADGADLHGEADFVCRREPASVLDAGCGTGRVAIELDRRGVEVVGVDADESMLATARRLAPALRWEAARLDDAAFDLGRTFDLVLLAGNVVLFTPAGTQRALLAGVARHVRPGGLLVLGFSLGRGYEPAHLDADAAAASCTPEGRWATWDEEPWRPGGDYAVSAFVRSDDPTTPEDGR